MVRDEFGRHLGTYFLCAEEHWCAVPKAFLCSKKKVNSWKIVFQYSSNLLKLFNFGRKNCQEFSIKNYFGIGQNCLDSTVLKCDLKPSIIDHL